MFEKKQNPLSIIKQSQYFLNYKIIRSLVSCRHKEGGG